MARIGIISLTSVSAVLVTVSGLLPQPPTNTPLPFLLACSLFSLPTTTSSRLKTYDVGVCIVASFITTLVDIQSFVASIITSLNKMRSAWFLLLVVVVFFLQIFCLRPAPGRVLVGPSSRFLFSHETCINHQ